MNIMIMGQHGRMNSLIKKQAYELGFHVELFDCTVEPKNKVDVIIDFSSPDAWSDLDVFFKRHAVPFVTGTTGLNECHYEQLKAWAKQQPVYHSTNFSLGITALRALLQEHCWEGWEIEISECHHTTKKDAPSGTALFLAEDLQFNKEKILVSRQHAHPGLHRIVLRTAGEELLLQHTVFNREVFVQGAIDKALWLKDLPPGDYSLQNKE